MSFLMPSVPKAKTPAPAIQANAEDTNTSTTPTAPPSLISTGSQGLKRKANTVKTSLIGGGE